MQDEEQLGNKQSGGKRGYSEKDNSRAKTYHESLLPCYQEKSKHHLSLQTCHLQSTESNLVL